MTIDASQANVAANMVSALNDRPADLTSALDEFARAGTKAERTTLGPLLVTAGAAPAAKDDRFARGVELSLSRIISSAPGRVQDLSLLWRLTSVSAMREHRRRVIAALNNGVPPFEDHPTDMTDPDDRRHFGDALLFVTGNWVAKYAAEALAAERDGEKARDALARVVFANVTSLADQVNLVREGLSRIRFEQQDPAVGRARRLAAILDSLGSAAWLAESDHLVGSNFGDALASLVSDILARSPPNDRAVAVLAASAVFRFVITAIRLHGTIAADAKTYSFLGPLRRSLGLSEWPEELTSERARVANQVLEQLIFLVRLKMPDADLRRVYIGLVGEAAAKGKLGKAADEADGLDPDDAYWVKTGTKRRTLPTQAAIEETAVASIDRDLALALREAENTRSTLSAISAEAVSAADFHSPRLASDLKNAFDRIGKLAGHVEAASRRRGLVLKGAVGELISFSPLEHEPTADSVGARTVRLRTRIVERVIDGQSAGVIVKGEVDAG